MIRKGGGLASRSVSRIAHVSRCPSTSRSQRSNTSPAITSKRARSTGDRVRFQANTRERSIPYSHSMVAGGFPVMS